MKILCPTDFSECGRAAGRVAVDLASRTYGAVELFHVIPARTTDRVALSADAASLDDALRSDGRARLAAECRELTVEGVQVTPQLGEGDVESSILSRAKAMAADIIVMGAHARPAVERLILGSVAERTLRRADRPVVIVPSELNRLGSGPEGRRPPRVVAALDGRDASAGAIDFVRALRRHFACDVTFVRLYWPVEEYVRLGLIGERSIFEPDADVIADLSRRMAIDVGALPGSGRVAFAVEPTWGDPAAALLAFTSKQGGDIVVMGAESRRGLARVAHPPIAERVARHARGAAVAFIPTPPAEPAARQAPGILTVLAVTDLSPEGNRAVPYAYSLLTGTGGVVELCYVHERALPSPAYVYDSPDGKLTDVERARLERELRALVPAQAERSWITTHVTVIDGGAAAKAILQAAERLAADAIVLGSHGRGAMYRAFLGSVSQDVVRHARRPVLVVPSERKGAS
jgi:nucleotide-binding universal stress UspA family protein